jgi:hypothetical protein
MRASPFSLSLTLPPVAALALLAAMTVGEHSGRPLMAYDPPRNGAEAAALGQAAALTGFLRAGEDPSRVYPLRAEALSSGVPRATILEAAVLSRREPIVLLLDHRGAIGDAAVRQELACLASDVKQRDIAELLAPNGTACSPGAALERWSARRHPQEQPRGSAP